MSKQYNLIGKTFGRLTVLEEDYEKEYQYTQRTHKHLRFWKCKCSCGSDISISPSSTDLNKSHTQSCGCLHNENTSKVKKKYNRYDLSGEYGIGYTSKNEEFYFDLEDYDKIKDICWSINCNGYVEGRKNGILYTMSQIIFNISINSLLVYDHISRERFDNRKNNLRKATYTENGMNKSIQSNNTSGVPGVSWDNTKQNWCAYINLNNKRINIGRFLNFSDAVYARFQKEIMYFDTFSPNYKQNNYWELIYYDKEKNQFININYSRNNNEVPKMDVKEISYEELQKIPSKHGSGALGSSNK